jgi:hypothetical protein
VDISEAALQLSRFAFESLRLRIAALSSSFKLFARSYRLEFRERSDLVSSSLSEFDEEELLSETCFAVFRFAESLAFMVLLKLPLAHSSHMIFELSSNASSTYICDVVQDRQISRTQH